MAITKNSTKNSDVLMNVVVLRSVYSKTGMKYFIQPCKDKVTGEYPDCVRHVDSHGDMILSEKDRESGKIFIRENETFVITDGQTFNLDNPREKAIWEAIKNCPMIAPERWAKDANGNYLIDGTMGWKNPKPRFGTAELYVDRPGIEAQQRNTKKRKYRDALNFIYGDERGNDGRVMKAKLLGKNMQNMPDAEVEDFLTSIAEKDPDRIIALYTGDDISLRLLFIEAREKKVIQYKNKVYTYGDNILLGATDEAVIHWMKDPMNQQVVSLIRKETYPDMFSVSGEAKKK